MREGNCCSGGVDVAAGAFDGVAAAAAAVGGYTVAGQYGQNLNKDYVVAVWQSSVASAEIHCDQRLAVCCRHLPAHVVGSLAELVVVDTVGVSCAQVNGPAAESSDPCRFGLIFETVEECFHDYRIGSLLTEGISAFHVGDAVVSTPAVGRPGSFEVRCLVRKPVWVHKPAVVDILSVFAIFGLRILVVG